MEEYQERVIEEKTELDEKITALEAFMVGGVYPNLTPVNQGLMMIQLESMRLYSNTLERRIELF